MARHARRYPARGAPMVLINARISGRSYRRWRWMGGLARSLLRRFDRILAQDDLAGQHFAHLGAAAAGLEVTGSLKEGAAPLGHDEAERVRITRAFAGRPVWLAASTHPGEEEVALDAHAQARRALPMLALILAPRHPVRGDGLAEMLRGRGLVVAQRSKGEPITAETDVYLADTLGEMGLWYRVASVSFVGGSLAPVGGHNPYEPALLGSAILHGPHVRNFADGYERLGAAQAAVLVRDAASLGTALAASLAPDRAAAMAAAAWETMSDGAEVTDRVLDVLGGYLDRERALMRAPGFWARPPDAPGLAARLLAPAAWVWAEAARRRLARPGRRVGIPVICVGNLTAGGAGKTPTVAALASLLAGRGIAAHVVSRGHGGSLAGPVRVDERRHTAGRGRRRAVAARGRRAGLGRTRSRSDGARRRWRPARGP